MLVTMILLEQGVDMKCNLMVLIETTTSITACCSKTENGLIFWYQLFQAVPNSGHETSVLV